MRIRLEAPGIAREQEFLAAVKRSRELHRELVGPPSGGNAYRRYLDSLGRSDRRGFFLVTRATNSLVGVIEVYDIVRGLFQCARLGYYAFAPYAGRGLMREGLVLVLHECFGEMRLHRLEAEIQPANHRSMALAAGLGFTLEPAAMRELKICGRWLPHRRWVLRRRQWISAGTVTALPSGEITAGHGRLARLEGTEGPASHLS